MTLVAILCSAIWGIIVRRGVDVTSNRSETTYRMIHVGTIQGVSPACGEKKIEVR